MLTEAGSGPITYVDFEVLDTFTGGGPPGLVAGPGGLLVTPVSATQALVHQRRRDDDGDGHRRGADGHRHRRGVTTG